MCKKNPTLPVVFMEKKFMVYYVLCLLFKQYSLTFVLSTQGHSWHPLLRVMEWGFEVIEICGLLALSAF